MVSRAAPSRLLLLPLLLTCCFRLSEADLGRAMDRDKDGVRDAAFGGLDCDGADPSVRPGATESCNGVDDDCDGEIDEGDAAPGTFWADADGDGHGDPATETTACTAPEGYVAVGDDCDDTSGAAYPGNEETCDGIDNDCDEQVDEAGDFSTFWEDRDGDGFGDPDRSTAACAAPDGYVDNGDGCNDLDADVHPDAVEVCNAIDDDCSGDADGADAQDVVVWYEDEDGDGYAPDDAIASSPSCRPPGERYVTQKGYCDDDNDDANPEAEEVCDGADNDCDGQVDFDVNVPADFAYVQNAIDAASRGERICVLAGTYQERLFIDKDVSLIGENSALTVLRAQAGDRVLEVEGLTSAAELRGFTLYGGEALIGGAVHIVDSALHVEDLLITGAELATDEQCLGAAMAITGPAAPTVSHVDIIDNGAICGEIYGMVFVQDTTAPVEFDHLSLLDNRLYADTTVAGGLAAYDGTEIEVTNSIFASNEGGYAGGVDASSATAIRGLAVSAHNAVVDLVNTVVAGNSADAGDGTVYSAGVYLDVGSRGTIVNTSVSSNDAQAALVVTSALYGPYVLEHSNVYDQASPIWSGSNPIGTDGNITADPGFIDATGTSGSVWNLRLSAGSALIDAGDPSILDADGTTSDIGAYGGPGGDDW